MKSRLKHAIEPFYRFFYQRCIHLFYFLPLKKKKVVFIQGNGEGYRCNLKYIVEEIIRQSLPYDMVWLVNDLSDSLPKEVRKVKYNRIRAVYELSTAHVVINNSKHAIYPVCKKEKQLFIYIPHGQSGAKRAENHSETLSEQYKLVSRQHSNLMDVFVTTSSYQTEDVRQYYWCNCDVWQLGFPRNDLFFHENPQLVEKVKRVLHIPIEKKILFYTPTFRDNGDDKAFAIELNQTLQALSHRFGGEWLAMVTLHPNFKWYKKPSFEFSENIINVSGYPDIQELLFISDVLITDYSSTMMDFCLTGRLVLRFATDVDKYKGMRGLKDLYFQMPFPLCRSNEELQAQIAQFNEGKYKKDLELFLKEYGTVDDGHAAERFIQQINLYCLKDKV